jgi:hypothetical protein
VDIKATQTWALSPRGRGSRTAGARQGEPGDAARFSGAEPEQAQAGFGQFIDGTLGHPSRVALVETQQTE